MAINLLKVKLSIDEKNVELLAKVGGFSSAVAQLRMNSRRMEFNFKARCLERIYVLITLAADNCNTGYPVAASLLARGVVETAGLLVLFEEKMAKSTTKDRLDIVKRFTFATKKFGKDKRAIHALDCVRALKPFHSKVELLYDLLCEAVHPNWLGVTQFREFKPDIDGEADHDELVSATVFQSLLLGHEVARKIELPSTDVSVG